MTVPRESVRRRVKSRVRVTGIVSSDGIQGNWFESQTEKQFYICLRADPKVLSFVSQPVKIFFEVDDKKHSHIPDAFVTYGTEAVKDARPAYVLYEVKSHQDLKDAKKIGDIRMKAAAARAYAEERGWVYRMILDLKVNKYAYNAAFLSYYRDMPLDSALAASILADVAEWPGITPQLLMQRRPKEQRLPALATVWTLLYKARLYADLTQRVSNITSIYPAGRPLYPHPVW